MIFILVRSLCRLVNPKPPWNTTGATCLTLVFSLESLRPCALAKDGGKGWQRLGRVGGKVLCKTRWVCVSGTVRWCPRSRGMGGKGRLQAARRGCGSSRAVAVAAMRLSWPSVVFLTHQGGQPRWKRLFWVEWHFLIHPLCLSPGYPAVFLGLLEISAVIALRCCLVCQQPVGRDPRLPPHQIYQLIPTLSALPHQWLFKVKRGNIIMLLHSTRK